MKMRAEGVEVHAGGGGYSGSGYKYDFAEEEAEINKRKLTKLVHGIEVDNLSYILYYLLLL